MDKILSRICNISNHPISNLDERSCMIYIRGLAACLYNLSKGSNATKMVVLPWIQSISPNINDIDSIWVSNDELVKKAVGIQRRGFKFFSMKEQFFFDVLYLAESSMKNLFCIDDIESYFLQNICTVFNKNSLKRMVHYFNTNNGVSVRKINKNVIEHRINNLRIQNLVEKKTLVVANVSAGKSTLINALVGQRVSKSLTTVCTQKLVFIHNKTSKDGIMIKDSQKQYAYYRTFGNIDSDSFTHASLPFISQLSSVNVCLIDTPGINNTYDSKHRLLTETEIMNNSYDCVIYVSNCQYNATNDESVLLSFLKKKCKKPIIFVLNQLDRFKQKSDSVQKMVDNFKSDLLKLGFVNPQVVPLSAYAAILFKLPNELLDEDDLYEKTLLEKRFDKDYYDFPTYISNSKSSDLLSKTGITYLEKTILKNL